MQIVSDIPYMKNPLTEVTNTENGTESPKNYEHFTDTSESLSIFRTRKMYVAASIVLLFSLVNGMVTTYSATATMDMQKRHSSIHPNNDQVTWIGSLMPVGALIGGSIGGYFSNLFGRKGILVFNTVPYVLGWLMISYAQSIPMVYAGRIVTGFSCGIACVAAPMYVVEISTPEVRGLLGSGFQLFGVTGVLFISFLGSIMTWRQSALSAAITSLIAVILMLFMPESPRWLITQKRKQEARDAFLFLQGELYDTDGEISKMEDDIKEQPAGGLKLKEFITPIAFKPLIFSFLLMFFQQYSGVNAILFYCTQIFKSAGSSMDPNSATIIVAAVQVIATLCASLLMDVAGRKILLSISSSCMSLCLIIFGVFDFYKVQNPSIAQTYGWLPLICLVGFIAAFSIGFGPAPWLMVSEMASERFRSSISGVSTAANWFFAFTVTKLYSTEEKTVNTYGVYWMYSCFCALAFLFSFFLLPETKGKSLNEIQDNFLKKKVFRTS